MQHLETRQGLAREYRDDPRSQGHGIVGVLPDRDIQVDVGAHEREYDLGQDPVCLEMKEVWNGVLDWR